MTDEQAKAPEWYVQMQARIEAVTAARAALSATTTTTTTHDLLTVAEWIYTGEVAGPVVLNLPDKMNYTHTADESTYHLPNRYRFTPIEDSHLPPEDPEGRDGPDYDMAAGDEGR